MKPLKTAIQNIAVISEYTVVHETANNHYTKYRGY
jgi:hypothetical protein